MSENNKGIDTQNDSDLSSSQGTNTSQLTGDTVTVQGTTFTREEIEEANKPQPNVILDKVGAPNTKLNRDNERVAERANEASDSTDTNTGGMIAGAAKGANQS
jgi:hypothetical protein